MVSKASPTAVRAAALQSEPTTPSRPLGYIPDRDDWVSAINHKGQPVVGAVDHHDCSGGGKVNGHDVPDLRGTGKVVPRTIPGTRRPFPWKGVLLVTGIIPLLLPGILLGIFVVVMTVQSI